MIKLSSFQDKLSKYTSKNINDKFIFWDNYSNIKTDMIEVNKIIFNHINHIKGVMGDALFDTFSAPGKMLRPAFVMLFSNFNQSTTKKREQLLNLAASIEMLHNATLIHDDIIDESNMRHGQPSIQAKYGKHIAVYAGDYLFAVSLNILSNNAKDLSSVKRDSKTMEEILLGETEQYDSAYDINISIKQYLEHIKGKTGVLFGLACFLGSYESGSSLTTALKAKKFGESLGQAFQIRDDILDYSTNAKDFKKPVLLDVKDGVYSAPLIYALQNDKSKELHTLVSYGNKLTREQLQQINRLVKEYGGVTSAIKLAEEYTNKAIKYLRKNWPTGTTRDQVEKLTYQLIDRKY